MNLIEITNPHLNALLLEANVLNIKELYNDVSIMAYAKQYAELIGYQPLEKAFVTKFSKLMVNDEKFHVAVRDLPDNAPDWAKEAHDKRELVAFQPTEDLNDKMSHISHYLVALRQDSQDTTDNNKKVFAEREINGFAKIGDFDTLVKKSLEYFKRGSKKANTSTEEGMTMIADVGGGARWYVLQTDEAFRREGRVLQNCIGKMYTLAKGKAKGYSILIMRQNNETVVAARVMNATKEVDEMKGKNNRPPIDKYMGGVLKLFRNKQLNLKIGPGAVNDFSRAGYFYIDNQLWTRNEAVKKYMTATDIAEVEGKQLVRIRVVPEMLDIVRDAYPGLKSELGGHYGGANMIQKLKDTAHDIYELRDGTGHASISALVRDKTIIGSYRNKKQVDVEMPIHEGKEDITSKEAQTLFKKLFELKLVNSVSGKVSKHLFWSERLVFDGHGGLQPAPHGKVKHSNKGHEWEHYTDEDTVAMLNRATKTGYSDEDITDPHSVYMHQRENFKGEKENVVFVRTKSGKLITRSVDDEGASVPYASLIDSNYKGGGKRDKKTVDSVVALANAEKLELTDKFKRRSGIIKNEKGEHEVHVPNGKELTGSIKGMKYDLSHIKDDNDRWAALRYLVTDSQIRDNRKAHPDRNGVQPHHDVFLPDFRRGGDNYRHNDRDVDDERSQTHDFPDGTVPDAMYVVSVKYGTDQEHKVAIQVTNNTIVGVDQTTGEHNFQHWDDFEKIADQLNTFAEENGLSIKKKQLMGPSVSKELRTNKGKFTTSSKMVDQRHQNMINRGDAGLEGTDTLPLENGTKVIRLTPEEQTKYLRQELKVNSTPGQAWKVVQANGDIESAFFVKKDEIQVIYTGQRWNDRDRGRDVLPTLRGTGNGVHVLKAIKGAAKAFGWTINPRLKKNIGRNLQYQTETLISLNRRGGKATTRGDSSATRAYKKLEARGLVSTTTKTAALASPSRRTFHHTLTNKGREYIKSVAGWENDEDILHNSHWDNESETEVHSDFKMPDKKDAPKKAASGAVSGVTRTGTKAQQALDMFRQHTIDNDAMPSRTVFMQWMQAPPFNMSSAGASTYYATTKKKYAALNEKYSPLATWELMVEHHLFLEDYI